MRHGIGFLAGREAQQQALAVEADRARQAAAQSDLLRQQAEKEKQELRARLLQQLNTVLSPFRTWLDRKYVGRIVYEGSFERRTAARQRLAKVFGIVLAYPSLHLGVEGHTNSVGSDEYNRPTFGTPDKGGARLSGSAGNFSGRDRSQRLREN